MLLLQLLLAVLFVPSILSTPENEKKCFFSESQQSQFERSARSDAMKVSVGCSGKLLSSDELMTRQPGTELYGTFDQYDLIITRGAGIYRISPDNADDLKSGIVVCEKHANELGHHWAKTHVRYHRSQAGGANLLSCSYPIDPHPRPRHINRPGTAFHLTREETKAFLMTAGIHLHVGLPVCKDHHEMIISRIAEAKEDQCDPQWTSSNNEGEPNKEEGKEDESVLQTAFVSFCKAAEIDRVCPKMSFADYARDTQTRKVRTVERVWWTTLELMVPGSEMEVWNRVCKSGNYRGWDSFGSDAASLILPEISHLYSLANDARTRDIILSQAAGPLSYGQLLPYFPGLTSYRFTKAKRIWGSQELPPEVTITRERWSAEKTHYLVHYMASPHMIMTLPYGIKKGKLSTGERIDIPNTIRNVGNAEFIRQYRQWMNSQGLGHLVYSDSTMIRMLNACPATKRHSLCCVDSYKASGYEAFDDIKAMLDRLTEKFKMDSEQAKDMWFRFLEVRLYLKHDYALHVKPDSRVPDHSLLFALSDPYSPEFASQPVHAHDLQCPRCINIEKTFREMSDYLSTLLLTADPSEKKEIEEMIFRLGNDRDAIYELKAHELRSTFTNLEKDRIIENLPENHALVTLDYGQKMLPTKPYEKQVDYYAKKGMSWHFSHVVANISNTLVQHLGVTMIKDDKQDSRSTVTILAAFLKELKNAGIEGVYIRSDNAPNYHCAPTLGSILPISRDTGVTIKDWSFSEVQNGKGPADRGCANCKFKIRQLVNAGKIVIDSQEKMFEALTKEPLMKGVSVYVGEVSDPKKEPLPSVINRVTDYSHFKNEVTGLRVWKYHGVGAGEKYYKLYSNVGVYKEQKRGGALADPAEAGRDKLRIKNRLPAKFWNYDPELLKTDEPGDRDQDTAVEPEPVATDGKKGLVFACWCGATFLKEGNYLNHLDYGVHKSHPLKTTAIDETLKYYKRCLEDTVQVRSLVPLQDAIDAVYDKTASFLTMGWGLRSAKKHGRYPESAKKMLQAFVVEKTKIGRRSDPVEAYNRMVADTSIPLEERMSKEQIKRYVARLTVTKVKKTKVVRGKRSEVEKDPDNEYDWIITEEAEGEWEIEDDCEDEGAEEDVELYWNYFESNKENKEIFDA